MATTPDDERDGMSLRAATNADAAAVRTLVFAVLAEHGLHPDPAGTDADLDDLETAYHAPGGRFDVLVDRSGRIVGSVGLLPVDADVVELRKMYLERSLRGRGHGRRLLEHALDAARSLGYRRIVLETASVLTDAIALYRGYGFLPEPGARCSNRCDQAMTLELVNPGPS